MAVYFLRSQHISRSKGARATRAAAYRAGERIRDERTSEVYNYTYRDDVVCKDIVIPADLASQPEMAWTQNRSSLWNAGEHANSPPAAHPVPEHDPQRQLQTPDDPHRHPQPDRDHDLGM